MGAEVTEEGLTPWELAKVIRYGWQATKPGATNVRSWERKADKVLAAAAARKQKRGK